VTVPVALISTPVLDSFGTVLIVAGVDNDLYAIEPDSGRDFWSNMGRSQIVARPQIWETDELSVLYVIESLDGRIRQFDLFSGERFWGFSCADISGDGFAADEFCQDAVEAEFAIAPSGNVIYYGDVFGRITCLEVAAFETEAPTSSPTSFASSSPTQQPQSSSTPSVLPSAAPSAKPSTPGSGGSGGGVAPMPAIPTLIIPASPTPADLSDDATDTETSSANSQEPQEQSDSASYAVFIGAGVGAFCALLLLVVMLSLMRRQRQNQKKRDEIVVEVIEDCESDDNETYELDEATDASSSDGAGIEVEFVGVRSVPRTPPRRSSHSKKKKKKKRKQLPQTPQTGQTLESIEELPEDVTAAGTSHRTKLAYQFLDEEDDSCFKLNLSEKFARTAETRNVDQNLDIESENYLADESGRVTPVARGGVGRPSGSSHLEISVGNNDLAPLAADAILDDKGSINRQGDFFVRGNFAQDPDGDSSDDETPPPPPPASTPQWSFYSLLQMNSSQQSKKTETLSSAVATSKSSMSVKNADLASPVPPASTKVEKQQEAIQLTAQREEKKKIMSLNGQESMKQEVSRDLRPDRHARSNLMENEDSVDYPKSNPECVEQDAAIVDLLPMSSTKKTPMAAVVFSSVKQSIDGKNDEPDPSISTTRLLSESPKHSDPDDSGSLPYSTKREFSESFELEGDPLFGRPRSSEGNVEEEKKENEETGVTSPAHLNNSRYTPISPSSMSRDSGLSSPSPLSSTGPLGVARALSPGSQSARSAQSSRMSAQSPSNASTDDDSLYTSATGKTGEQQVDDGNLSPLSAFIFDKEIERNVLPVDEALEALSRPNLRKKYTGGNALGSNKFHYPDDDDAPDDELVLAPGSQYMSQKQDDGNGQKYGRSVRSKREPSLPQQGSSNYNKNSFAAYDSDNESPLAAIYNQLAALGQQKAEEKRHMYKRRSKKEEELEEPGKEQEGDTWGSFLNELAEAEKQFFAPNATQQASLLKFGGSHDSEDSEVARINKVL
jgi:hypothetical protein